MDVSKFWNEFRFDYNLDKESLSRELITIEAYKQAALNIILPPEWCAKLDKLNRVRAVYGTTALEGNPLSEAEVSHQMEMLDKSVDALSSGKLTKEQQQIRNASLAQDWVKKRFVLGSSPVMLEDLLAMHKMITEQSDETHNFPGELRTFSVQVGSEDMGGVHIGAPYEELRQFMENFIYFVNSGRFKSEHPVVKALLAHFFLVTLHPFGDGNGRVSRLLEAGILFQHDYNVHGFYGLSNFFYRNEREYKTLLQQCRRSNPFEVTPFVSFGIKGFASELAGINNFVKTKLNRVVYRQMLVCNYNKLEGLRRRLLNLREYQLLEFLVNETEPLDPFSETPSRIITLSELIEHNYIKAAYKDVSQRTLVRELIRLASLGFIKINRETGALKSLTIALDFGAIARYQVS
jgi:Fic family protein